MISHVSTMNEAIESHGKPRSLSTPHCTLISYTTHSRRDSHYFRRSLRWRESHNAREETGRKCCYCRSGVRTSFPPGFSLTWQRIGVKRATSALAHGSRKTGGCPVRYRRFYTRLVSAYWVAARVIGGKHCRRARRASWIDFQFRASRRVLYVLGKKMPARGLADENRGARPAFCSRVARL